MGNYFLLAIGYWNLIGSVVLYFMLNPAIADTILRQWIEIITVPYEVGKYGSLWLVWAASTNTFFSVMNVFAVHSAHASQIVVICGDLFVYGILLLSMLAVFNNKSYGRGLYVSICLSIFWMLWAIYALFVLSS